MLPIVWLQAAVNDLSSIILYIANENPSAARRLKSRLQAAPLPLVEHPYLFLWGGFPVRANSSRTPITSSFTALPQIEWRS
ncbi:type II toxin-antitoxin system RelE/ParE family toxin [Pseudomonas viridiflava]|uniref:type II toxin-antitoxin system RelE/ParE family toxin n=1 Tax=Pseudomonas viridiflava TaxID=33069 RepID=UPI0039B87EEA